MKKVKYFLFFCLFWQSIIAQNNFSDINIAKQICNTNSIVIPTLNGVGSVADELYTYSNVLHETNIAWFKFKIATGDVLRFKIVPQANFSNQLEDLDFVLFDAEKNPITYSLSGPQVRGKTRTFCTTGLEGANTGIGNNALDEKEEMGCGLSADGFTKDILVSPDQIYYLAVNNFLAKTGFTLSWLGTCTFTCLSNNISEGSNQGKVLSTNSKSGIKDVFPNPANNTLTWEISSESIKNGEIKIMDAMGRVVFHRHEQIIKGDQRLTFDISQFQSGLYTIMLSYEGERESYTQKFVKAN